LPAAIIATARRGTEGAPGFDERFTNAEDFNFAFDFFIRISIYLDYHPMAISSTLAYNLSAGGKLRQSRIRSGGHMPKYVIERDIPKIGEITPDQVIAISQKSCSVLNKLGPQIQWVHSYVTQDKIYCVYIAPNERMVKQHARQGRVPSNRISEVKIVIDPTSAEA